MAGLIDGIWPTSESQWDAMVAEVRDNTDDEAWLFGITSGLPEKERKAITVAHDALMELFGEADGNVLLMATAEADFYRAALKAWKGRDVPEALAIESRTSLSIELEVLRLSRVDTFELATVDVMYPLRNIHTRTPTLARVMAANGEATPWSAATMLSAGLIRGGVEVKVVQGYLAKGIPSDTVLGPQAYDEMAKSVRKAIPAATPQRERKELCAENLPDDPHIRNAFANLVGKQDARLPLEYEQAIRKAVVLRHGNLGKPYTRSAAAAEMALSLGHSSREAHQIITESTSLRRMVQDAHRELPDILRAKLDQSDIMEAAEGMSKMDRKFAVLDAFAERLVDLEDDVATDALAEIHRKLGRISLVSSVHVSARRAVDSWLDAKAGNPNIRSITAENGKVVAVIATAGEPPVKVVDDGRRISCPTDCHAAIAASVAAFAKRGTTTLKLKAADVERAKIGYFECMRQGIKPVVELPVSTVKFLKDVRDAEVEGLREGLEGGNLAASIETYLAEAGYEGIDIDHAVGLVFRGQPPVEIGLFDTIDHDLSDHEIGTFDTVDHDEPQSAPRHRF